MVCPPFSSGERIGTEGWEAHPKQERLGMAAGSRSCAVHVHCSCVVNGTNAHTHDVSVEIKVRPFKKRQEIVALSAFAPSWNHHCCMIRIAIQGTSRPSSLLSIHP